MKKSSDSLTWIRSKLEMMMSFRLFILFFLCTATLSYGKVYDCFPFFNEIELLKMRLEELDSVVDHFVLVESAETHKGNPKPLYFKENRALFQKYLPKIIHVMLEERHPEWGAWQRENYQRECISRGLFACQPSDIVLVSDVDEIPRSTSVQRLKTDLLKEQSSKKHKHKKHKKKKAEKQPEIYALQMSIYFFHLNRQTPTKETWGGGQWVGTVATTYRTFIKYGAQQLRAQTLSYPRLRKAGWHFTWLGGKEKIRMKMASVADNYDSQITDEEIERWIRSHPIVPIDSTFPFYVQKNRDYLKSIGFIAE